MIAAMGQKVVRFRWWILLGWVAVAAALMVLTRCVHVDEARRSIDWQVLLAIACALGIGRALENSGAANQIAGGIIQTVQGNPWLALAAIYLMTSVMTEVITNSASAALMFPFALSTAQHLDANVYPFVICVMIAASASFATPISYQTNLMVYGPGGYRFSDYLRIGIPLDITVGTMAVVLIPRVWPFFPLAGS